MQDGRLNSLNQELEKLLKKKINLLEHPTFSLKTFLFEQQLSFVTDPNPFKTAVCSRRAGKTIACAADLISTAITQPETICLYVTLSHSTAKKIMWPELLKIKTQFNLKAITNETALSLKFENGSIIYLSGAHTKAEIEKFRGLRLKKVYIDEAQSFKSYLEQLMDEILAPALMDMAGHMYLIGTPGPIPDGYFHDCSVKSSAWSHHTWTFWDNPFIRQKYGTDHQEVFTRELQRRGVDAGHPSMQREWFGKWVLDSESLLLHYSQERNHFDHLPPKTWNYIMGIDLGFIDADAVAVLAWSESCAETYLVEEKVIQKEDITALVRTIKDLEMNYPIAKMVIDEGGLGKKIAEEIRRRHHIPLLQAEKSRKFENLALLNDALRRSHFKAKKDSRFAQDCFKLEIDRDKTTPDKIKIKDTFHSDIVDAVLYAARESPAFTWRPPEIKPKIGTLEWARAEEKDMFTQALERAEAEQEVPEDIFEWS